MLHWTSFVFYALNTCTGIWDGVAIDVEDVKARNMGRFVPVLRGILRRWWHELESALVGGREDRFEFLWREGTCLGRRRSWNITVECRQVFCVLHDGSVTMRLAAHCVVTSDTRRSTWNQCIPTQRSPAPASRFSVCACGNALHDPAHFSCCGTFPKCLISDVTDTLGAHVFFFKKKRLENAAGWKEGRGREEEERGEEPSHR